MTVTAWPEEKRERSTRHNGKKRLPHDIFITDAIRTLAIFIPWGHLSTMYNKLWQFSLQVGASERRAVAWTVARTFVTSSATSRWAENYNFVIKQHGSIHWSRWRPTEMQQYWICRQPRDETEPNSLPVAGTAIAAENQCISSKWENQVLCPFIFKVCVHI